MMEKAEPPGYPPADARRRVIARAVDLLVALAPLALVPRSYNRTGAMICAALLLFGDQLAGAGRSVGKRLAGLRVVVLATRRPPLLREAMARNLLFAAALLPSAFGATVQVSAAALLAVLALEGLVATQPLTRDFGRRRLGDLFAGTQVIDASIALGLPSAVSAKTAAAPAPLASRAARSQETAAECASP